MWGSNRGRRRELSPIESLCRGRVFFKLTAITVVVAFLGLTLQPLAIAANLPKAKAAAPKPPSQEERLTRTIEDIEDRLERLEKRLTKKEDAQKEKDDLKVLRQELEVLDTHALKGFDAIEQHLKDKKLPQVILDRHYEAVKTYKQEMRALKANLQEVEIETDEEQKRFKTKKAKEHLKTKQKRRKRAPIDPNNLPTRALEPNRDNKPKLHKKDFHAAGLHDNPTVKIAALGDFTFDKLPSATDPAYLAPTPEVVFSDAIKAKAAELEYNPVKIFNWVHDHTEWLPTWGAIQNADVALLTQKGNAFDLSSLLIALLRASGIPARYVHGTIEIPTNKFMNWAGGFTDPNGAWDLVSAAGIPITAVTSGGKITKFRMEHIWVEAAIDFHPSRGAINKSADMWVQLDPSFKQYVTERGYDMHTLLNFNGEAHFMAFLTDPTDETPYQYYSKQVLNYLNTTMPDWTLEGLYGHERIVPLKPVTDGDLRLLAASLPYQEIVKGYTAAEIPDGMRHRITIEVGTSPSYTVSLSRLGLDRLTLSYIQASAADDAVVDDYGSLFATPAYLVRVKPQLRKNGQVVAVGNGVGIGEPQSLTIRFQAPTLYSNPIMNDIKAGSYSAVVVQGVSESANRPSVGMRDLRTEAGLNEQGQSSLDASFGQLLHNIGVLWFFDLKYERDFYATTQQVAYTRLLSQNIVTADLTVHYWFGIPRSVEQIFYSIDADTDMIAVAATNGDARRTKDFMLLGGLTGSAWEHLELEGVFNGPGASAVKIIKIATQQGIPIYTIDSTNIGQVLPQLALVPEDVTDIVNAVNAGKRVIAPQTEVTSGQWRGAGIITLDPIRGDGLYLLTGGLAGGQACKSADNESGICSEGDWENMVATKLRIAEIARQVVVGKAKTLIGTPYGLGCKDPITTTNPEDATKYCKLKVGTGDDPDQPFWIDCSGLVASAYRRIGFPHFAGKISSAGCCSEYYDAQGQWDYINSVSFGRTPLIPQVGIGDLMFWFGTWTGPTPSYPNRTPRVDHVAIVIKKGTTLEEFQWLAAEGNIWQVVHQYGFSDFPPYHKRIEKFHGFGSIFNDQ